MKAHPTNARLVVEVCANTEEIDRAKATLYARAGIPECWLVIAERAEIKIHRDPCVDGYTCRYLFCRGGTAESTALPALRVTIDDLFPSN